MSNHKPTKSEMEILAVLWQKENATVREIHTHLNEAKPTAYTTVLKFLQIMTEKGLVKRDAENKAHIYSAQFAQTETQTQILKDLLDTVFDGSAKALILQLIEAKLISDDESKEIRKLLKGEKKKKKSKKEPS